MNNLESTLTSICNLLFLGLLVYGVITVMGCNPQSAPSENEIAEIMQDCDVYSIYHNRNNRQDSITGLTELHPDPTVRECAAYIHLISEINSDSSMINRTSTARHRALRVARNLAKSIRESIDNRAIEESNLIMEQYSVPTNRFGELDHLE